MSEGFATLLTFEGLLTSVDPQVRSKRCTLTKGPPTLLTPEWFLTCVSPHVLSEVNGLFEHFLTYATLVHSGSPAAHWMAN